MRRPFPTRCDDLTTLARPCRGRRPTRGPGRAPRLLPPLRRSGRARRRPDRASGTRPARPNRPTPPGTPLWARSRRSPRPGRTARDAWLLRRRPGSGGGTRRPRSLCAQAAALLAAARPLGDAPPPARRTRPGPSPASVKAAARGQCRHRAGRGRDDPPGGDDVQGRRDRLRTSRGSGALDENLVLFNDAEAMAGMHETVAEMHHDAHSAPPPG